VLWRSPPLRPYRQTISDTQYTLGAAASVAAAVIRLWVARASCRAIVRGADLTQLQPTASPVRGFLDWPVVTDPAEWSADVALIGIQHGEPYPQDPRPNDQASAPDAIRLRSEQISCGRDQWDFDLDTPLAALLPRCIDMGNVGWGGGSYDAYSAAISDRARHLWKEGAKIFALGGDHGVTIPLLDALDAVGETVHVFHVDAHLDWRADVGGVLRGYSSPLRWASSKPQVTGMTQVGMRQTGSARRSEVAAARAYGSHVFPAEELYEKGWIPVLATIPIGSAVYITIDADGMDPLRCRGSWLPRRAAYSTARSPPSCDA
jgi:agmatinase